MTRHSVMFCVVVGALYGCQGSPAAADSTSSESTSGGTTGDAEYVPLIDQTMWQELDAVSDPLADHRPDVVECTIAGWYLEEDHLEIDTNSCNYLALHQPSLVALTEGHDVQLIMYHFDLTAPAPATAHVEILVDGQSLWSEMVDIPGDAFVWDLEFPAPFSAPLGSEVIIHLHNHGQNVWVLQDLNTRP